MDERHRKMPSGLGARISSRAFIAASAALTTAAMLVQAEPARADEPRSVSEPRPMMEPGEVVDVVDAFDDGDDFDIHLSLGFNYQAKTGRIRRESSIEAAGLTTGNFTSSHLNVASYSETTSRIIPQIEAGLYKDLSLRLRLPIIINNSRELTDLDGSANIQSVAIAGAPGEQLFSIPFQSPDRSGVEHLETALSYNIFNQARDRTKPTWLVRVLGTFPMGEPMHACNANPADGQVECAHPADIDRDGQQDGGFEGANVEPRDPGIARGTVGLGLETIISKRVKYLEPYGGLRADFEFPVAGELLESNFSSALVNHPPLEGHMMIGLMMIPWEYREKMGRLTFDLRLTGTYRSDGRDYHELFDALGSSAAPSLRNPNFVRYVGDEPDTSSPAFFGGLSTVEGHGKYRASGSVTWQAAEYVKFSIGLGFEHVQAHLLGTDKSCNSDLLGDLSTAGPCRKTSQDGSVSSTGVPNPHHRPTIHTVGRRFLIEDAYNFDFAARGVFMF